MTEELTPYAEVVAGLSTKADKIRALLKAGYLRTEIADLLGIRYQHVRNVLKRSGLDGGLKKVVELEPVEIEIPDEPPQPASWKLLLKNGFAHLADWQVAGEGIELTAKAPDKPGVYASAIGDVIKYVGITQRTFHERFYNYKQGYARQRTSARVKKLIVSALADGTQVKVLIAMPSEVGKWHGLPVDVAAGLEIALIRMLQPEWNMMGVKKAA